MRYESFEQVEAWRVERLREVAARGDSRERVWAGWALGLRVGPDDADAALVGEPDAGARRHLTIIVAGFGRAATLERLAAEDGDDRVRATAWQNLLSTDLARVDAVYARLADERSAAVREAILRFHDSPWPAQHLDLLVRLTADPSLLVRFAAVERLATLGASTPIVAAAVDRRLASETDRRLRRRLIALARDAGRIVLEQVPAPRGSSPYLPMVIETWGLA